MAQTSYQDLNVRNNTYLVSYIFSQTPLCSLKSVEWLSLQPSDVVHCYFSQEKLDSSNASRSSHAYMYAIIWEHLSHTEYKWLYVVFISGGGISVTRLTMKNIAGVFESRSFINIETYLSHLHIWLTISYVGRSTCSKYELLQANDQILRKLEYRMLIAYIKKYNYSIGLL